MKSRLMRFVQANSSTPRLSAFQIWALSGWIGLMCGLAESGIHLGWRFFEHRVGTPDLWVNWNAAWMAPFALAAWLLGFGVLLSVSHRLTPRFALGVAPYALIAIGAWSALSEMPGLYPWAINLLTAGLALRLGRLARFDSERFRRFARASLPYAIGLWLILFVSTGVVPALSEPWALAYGSKPPANAPNVLLVVLDTVRTDNLSLHGYERSTSPRLEAWAHRGVRFDQARSTTPFTLGTHASLFTGYWMSQTSARVNLPLDGERRTLAEHLRDRGYATGGFVGNIFYGSAHYGLDRGFLHYHDIPGNITRRVTIREFFRSCRLGSSLITWFERKWRILRPMQRLRLDAGELNREALAWIDRNQQSGRPYFLFMNYFDAHSPYSLPGEAPQPFSRITANQLEAKLKHLEHCEAHQNRDDSLVELEIGELREDYHAQVRDAYDDGIAWIDRKLDELLRELDRRGVLENTLVVITADHGEMLGEHGLMGHGEALSRQVVHVPLIVLGARGMGIPQGEIIQRPASVRDVPATILDLLDDPESGRFPGQSLSRFWNAPHNNENETQEDLVLSEMEHMPWMPRRSRTPAAFGPMWLLTEGHWSYHRQNHETLGVQERLFDLADDFAEEHDLANDPTYRAVLDSLRSRFEKEYASRSES